MCVCVRNGEFCLRGRRMANPHRNRARLTLSQGAKQIFVGPIVARREQRRVVLRRAE